MPAATQSLRGKFLPDKILITDIAWKGLDLEEKILSRLGATLVLAERGDEQELASLAADVDGILTCWKQVTEKVLRNAAKCLSVGRYGIGLDNIDLGFATKSGIVVTNVPTYCVDEVSEHAMAMILSMARGVAFFDRAIKGGTYNLNAGTPLYRMNGKTLGIVGFGNIGRALYRKAKGFGLKVISYDPKTSSQSIEGFDVELVSFQDLLRNSDYVSIHAPLTSETRHLFNLEAFRLMKPSAFLVNTSRGDLIDPEALLEALNQKLLAGAGLDVFSPEPPDPRSALLQHPRLVATPHAAFNSEESLVDLRETTARQMADVLSGKLPAHVVNAEVLGQENLRPRLERSGPDSTAAR
jgi:D-3-phosphoglycerate dehydrogenase / 2-oxoglutarate reductase